MKALFVGIALTLMCALSLAQPREATDGIVVEAYPCTSNETRKPYLCALTENKGKLFFVVADEKSVHEVYAIDPKTMKHKLIWSRKNL